MHTALYRANALFTTASTTLAVMCILATVTDLAHKTSPLVAEPTVTVEGLQKEGPNERAYLSFSLSADLTSLFTWNTKQAFIYAAVEWQTDRHHVNQAVIWNHIAEHRGSANISLPHMHVQFPFTLTDQGVQAHSIISAADFHIAESSVARLGTSLTGRPFNMTVAWETIPYAGALFAARRTFGPFQFPEERISVPVRHPGRAWS